MPDYLQQRADDARERHEMPLTGGSSAYEDLTRQIGEHDLNDHEREVMEYLIGSLDDDGFLRKDLYAMADELAIYHNIDTNEEELQRLLHIVVVAVAHRVGLVAEMLVAVAVALFERRVVNEFVAHTLPQLFDGELHQSCQRHL